MDDKREKLSAPLEIRMMPTCLSVRQSEKDEKREKKLQGYAARFNTIADLYWFDEEILPGAFTDSIARDDIRALIDHDSSLILGRNRANTLVLSEDTKGLYSIITPPETNAARDIIMSVERGDVDGMSFQFFVDEERWRWSDDPKKNDLRQIIKATLRDVSIVTFPAYTATDVSYRSSPELRSAENIYKQALAIRKKNEPRGLQNYMGLLRRYVEHCQQCN